VPPDASLAAEVSVSRIRIAILGAGAYGTSLGIVLCGGVPGIRAGKSRSVTLWSREPEVVRDIREQRMNTRCLPGVPLPRGLAATTDLDEAIAANDIFLFAVPSGAVREVAFQVGTALEARSSSGSPGNDPPSPQPVLIAAINGLEAESLARISQVITPQVPEPLRSRVLALSGPSLARELCRGVPTAVVLACHEIALARDVRRQLQTPILKMQVSRDVAGVELGGALKNAYSLALGLCDGLGLGLNTKAAIITRALPEMTRLGVALGGRRATFTGLAGLGDLLGTGLSDQSRNRRAGEEFALRVADKPTAAADPGVVEGIGAARAALQLAAQRRLRMPLLEGIGAVLDGHIDPLKMILRMVG
jgi:glycerol-3-phosphate dehydrogenase (NAD(P)+)